MASKKTENKNTKTAATEADEQKKSAMSSIFARAKGVVTSTPVRDLGRSSVAGVGLTLGFAATSKLLDTL